MKNNNKLIKKALKERESRYRNLVEGLNEAIYRMSLPDGKYEYFSPAVKKVFGYSAKEFLNNPLLIRKIIHPDSKNYFKEKWAELTSGKVPPTYKYSIIDLKGKQRWIIQSNKGVFDSNGNIFAIEGICRNITKQKKVEETLKRSEEMHRRLFDTSPSYIVVLNKTGTITSCNESLLKHFKKTKENVVGKHFAELSFLSPKDTPRYLKIFASVISGKKVKPFEISWKHLDGKIYFCELFVSTIKEVNKIIGVQILLNDITERKKTEKFLRESEEKYRTLVETLPTRIWLKDKNSTFLSCNKALAKDLEIIPSDIVGKTDYDFFPKKIASKYIEDDKKVLKSGKTADIEEIQIINGKKIDIHTIKTPVKDENGNIYGTMGMFWDESERKKAEGFIKIQRNLATKLSNISNLSKALKVCVDTAIKATGMDCGGVYLVDKKTQDINLSYSKGLPNSFIKSASKYSKDSPNAKIIMAGKPIYIQHHKLSVPLDKISYKEKLLTIAAIPIKHEGSVIACLNIASYTLSEIPVNTRNILESIANQTGGVIARLISKEALQKSEENYRLLVENQTDLVSKVDNKGRYLFVSPSYCKLFGKTEKEFIGKASMPLVHKDDKELTAKAMKKINKPPYTSYIEQRAITKHGWRWISWAVKSIFDKNNNITGVVASGRDITDRKKAEEALKESEEFNKSILESSPSPKLVINLDTSINYVNPAFEKLTGFKSKEITGIKAPYPWWIKESQDVTYRKLNEAMKNGLEKTEISFNKKNGEKLWVELTFILIKKDGETKYYLSSWVDITERKKAEGKLVYLSFHDSLTGIYNRTFFSEELERLQKSRDFPISIISLDIDGLKIINDYSGHSKGDELLTTLTSLVQKAIRESDIFARVGGDEFMILLPKTDYDKGREIIDRINEEIENHNNKNESFPLILSTGLATSLNKIDKLIETGIRADNAMYNEKNSKKQKSREIIGNYLNKLNK